MSADARVVKPIQRDQRGILLKLHFQYVVQGKGTATMTLSVLEFGFGGNRDHDPQSESLNASIEFADGHQIPCGYTTSRNPTEMWNSIKQNLDHLFSLVK